MVNYISNGYWAINQVGIVRIHWSSISRMVFCLQLFLCVLWKMGFLQQWLIERAQFWLWESCFFFAPDVQVRNLSNFPQQRTLCFCSWLCSFLFYKRPMEINQIRYDFVLGILYGHHDWHCNYRFLHCLCFSKSVSECSEPLTEKICAKFYYSI